MTRYIWDVVSDNVLMETDDAGATRAVYTQEPDLYGELISQYRDGQASYYHFDGQGSTRAVTDGNQNVVEEATYTAFGEVVEKTSSIVNPFGYKGALGYYANPHTGDYYVRRRPYDPRVGRWIALDPIGFVDGSNRYLFVFNSPVVLEDPSGLWCDPCCCCAVSVTLNEKTIAEQTRDPVFGLPGIGVQFTVNFKTEWVRKVIDVGATDDKNDCELVWNERSTLGLTFTAAQKKALEEEVKKVFGKDVTIENQKPREWFNGYEKFWFLKMFKPWRDDRTKPCPGTEDTPITDTPGVWNVARNSTKVNVIQFELMVKSAPNCDCVEKEKSLYLEAFVRMKRGVPIWRLNYLDGKPGTLPEKDYTKL